MSKFKFPSFTLGSLFKRKAYDPAEPQSIVDEDWDEITTGSNNVKNTVSVTGKYHNPNLPLEEQINLVNQKLELLRKSLPNLKK
jgi:hypothetical protein